MSFISEAVIKFGPVTEEQANDICQEQPKTPLGQILDKFHTSDISSEGTQVEIHARTALAGSENFIIYELTNYLIKENHAYTMQFAGGEKWTPTFTYWRPGMPQPITHETNSRGVITVPANEVVAALQGNLTGLQAIEEKFELGDLILGDSPDLAL